MSSSRSMPKIWLSRFARLQLPKRSFQIRRAGWSKSRCTAPASGQRCRASTKRDCKSGISNAFPLNVTNTSVPARLSRKPKQHGALFVVVAHQILLDGKTRT